MMDFFGRLHPLVVHMPIGILLLAGLFDFLSLFDGWRKVRRAVPLMVMFGAVSGAFALLSGFLLADQTMPEEGMVFRHKLFAIVTEILTVCLLAVMYLGKDIPKAIRWKIRAFLFLVLSTALMLTGHFGGTMTHGEGYLFASAPESVDRTDTSYFALRVRPVLESRCYNCHGSGKQKGGLRLDSREAMLRGGKHGPVLGGEQLLLHRIKLPAEDEEHMPPKDRTQLSDQERSILTLWIEGGASFSAPDTLRVGEASVGRQYENWIPETEPGASADQQALETLRMQGAVVTTLAQASGWLVVGYHQPEAPTEEFWKAWKKCAALIASARFSHSGLRDADLAQLAEARELRLLMLDHTAVSDKGLTALSGLPDLEIINAVSTAVTGRVFGERAEWPYLRQVYLFNSPFEKGKLATAMNTHARLRIDTGGISLPFRPTDTTEFKTSRR